MSEIGGILIALQRLSACATGRYDLRGKRLTQKTVLAQAEDIANELLAWVAEQRNPASAPTLSLEGLRELEANIEKMDEGSDIRKVLIRRGKVLREALESFGIEPPPKPAYYSQVRRSRK